MWHLSLSRTSVGTDVAAVTLCAGSCRRRTLKSVSLSFQSLTPRRSFPRPLCRVWPPHQEPSLEATAKRDATPLVRQKNAAFFFQFYVVVFSNAILFLHPSCFTSRSRSDGRRTQLTMEKDSSSVQLQLRAKHPKERCKVRGRHLHLRQSRYCRCNSKARRRSPKTWWQCSEALLCPTRSRRRGSPWRVGQNSLLISA